MNQNSNFRIEREPSFIPCPKSNPDSRVNKIGNRYEI